MVFVSKSGPIRSKIALAKNRMTLKGNAALNHAKADMNKANAEELHKFIDRLEADIVTIKRSIDEIMKYDSDWTTLITDSNSPDAQEEETIYEATAGGDKGYLKIIDSADALLESHDRLIRDTKSKLLLPTDSANSATTVTTGSSAFETSILKLVNTIQNSGKSNIPTIDIPFFDGKLEDWRGWHQLIEVKVNKKNVSDAEKRSFVISKLSGDALQCVKAYPVNDQNYPKIMDKLKENYGKDRDIKLHLIDKLRNAPEIVNDTKSIRQEIERCEAWIRQLEDMGEPINTLDIERSIENRLPKWLLLKTTEAKLDDPTWNATKLREKVLRQLTVNEEAERMNKSQNQPNAANKKKSHQPTTASSTATVAATNAKPQTNSDKRKRNNDKPFKCVFCDGGHRVSECKTCVTDDQKKDVLRKKKRCFICLGVGHTSTNCTRKDTLRCFFCKAQHRTVWCKSNKSKGITAAVSVDEPPKDVIISAAVAAKDEVNCAVKAVPKTLTAMKEAGSGLLISRKCTIANPADMSQQMKVLVLFDCGSTASFIKANFARELHLDAVGNTVLNVNTFGAKGHVQVPSEIYNISFAVNNNSTLDIKVKSTPTILKSIWTPQIDPLNLDDIANLQFVQDEPILLVGIDYFFKFIKVSNAYPDDGLTWVESLFGPIVCGKGILPNEASVEYALPIVTTTDDDRFPFITPDICSEIAELANNNADEIFAKAIWAIETIGIRDPFVMDEYEQAVKIFKDIVYLENNRYVVSWLKHDISELPTALNLCIGRLKVLYSESKKDGLLEPYDEILKEQIANQFQEVIPDDEIETEECHYNPHFLVKNLTKLTTKLRIVYDASAAARGQKSLNDCLLNGKPF
uniref:Peptidase aspartic putative domain-containing protein n=1 Tax=Panagrolaimus sp. PS1159 TaxID=55785 RepID=A0AC35EUT0_9BILA